MKQCIFSISVFGYQIELSKYNVSDVITFSSNIEMDYSKHLIAFILYKAKLGGNLVPNSKSDLRIQFTNRILTCRTDIFPCKSTKIIAGSQVMLTIQYKRKKEMLDV